MAMTNNEILAAAHEVRIPDEAGVGRFSTPFQLLARADATVGGSSRSHEWKKLGRIDKRSLKHDGKGRGEQKQNKKTTLLNAQVELQPLVSPQLPAGPKLNPTPYTLNPTP